MPTRASNRIKRTNRTILRKEAVLTGYFYEGRLALDVPPATPRVAFAFELLLAEELFDHVSGDVRLRLNDADARLRIHELGLEALHVLDAVALEEEPEGMSSATL